MAQNETAELSQFEHVLISRPLRDAILTWFNRGNLRLLSETSKTIRSLICGPFFSRAKHAYTKGKHMAPEMVSRHETDSSLVKRIKGATRAATIASIGPRGREHSKNTEGNSDKLEALFSRFPAGLQSLICNSWSETYECCKRIGEKPWKLCIGSPRISNKTVSLLL